ncbi:MAG: MBL fold metallo-hydrolase [Balneolaceae bacterium]|nr:MBL fold metallo-hydrolase [Balneolaceae bacterium]
MFFKQIFDEKLAQYAYLIGCQDSGEAIIVDPMRDIDQYEKLADEQGLKIVAAADTHIHADYLTGMREFAERGVKVFASDEGGEDWKYEWLLDSEYDYQLLKDGDRFHIGNIHFEAWHTPGHTPEHLTYKVTDGAAADDPMGLLSGDFVFVGDVGRPDLLESAAGQKGVMESSARTLYDSVTEFMRVPEYLQVWPGHGAGSACGKALGAVPESTVGYELRYNPSIKAASSEQNFVDFILEGQPEPPLYFARMKRDNRGGPGVLGDLPQPRRLNIDEFIEQGQSQGNVILDTRERSAFMNGYIAGSLLSTLDKSFNTVAGSFIREEEQIYLVINENRVEEAVRDLVRIGLDNIVGYITPADLAAFHDRGEQLERIDSINFKETGKLVATGEVALLDVRKASEYDEKHIEGAINIAHTRLLERLDDLPKDRTLLVHCLSGARASVSAALLEREGFEVKWIDDHIDNWPELEKGRE